MKRVSIVIVLIVWLVQLSNAATFYVDINGNDATGDGSSGKPWRTLKFAVSKVSANQGHTIKLSAGTFIEQGPVNVPPQVSIEGVGSSTIIKATSSFYHYPTNPGWSTDKFLIILSSSSWTNGNQSIKNITIDGDQKKLHGGILVRYRSNVLIDGVTVKYVNFSGIWLWGVRDSRLTNSNLLNCSWGGPSYAAGALSISYLERVEIDHLDIDENVGYGIKVLGTVREPLYSVKIHHNNVSVTPFGTWLTNSGNPGPNIAVELWNPDLKRCEIYDNFMDNVLSIVTDKSEFFTPPAEQTIRVYNNVFDHTGRAGGRGYGIELTAHNAEIDHNYFLGGTSGIVNWNESTQRITFQNWKIHHNIFHGLANNGYLIGVIAMERDGINGAHIYNNSVELSGTTTIHFLQVSHGGVAKDVRIENNLIIDNNTSYKFGAQKMVNLVNGAILQNSTIRNNFLQKIPVGSVAGVSYSNNYSGDPQTNKSGNRPSPYYMPKQGSPLIDKGVNITGHSYSGSATDIGAYEYGATTPPPANTPPSIGLSAPSNNASFAAGSSITLTANAADANGTVSKVEFFNGTTKLGEDATGPYSFVWNNVAAGTYTITARATDNQGATTTSSPVTITVVGNTNTAPTVSITSPANSANFNAGSSITINANAADANGTVSKVEFFNGTTKLGEDTSSPYSFTWSNVAAGTYSITARATDNQNAITNSAAITILVNALPTVSLTGPANNSTLTAPAPLTLTATAADADGTVSKVEFFNGTTKLGEDATGPYSFVWNNVAAGTYTITAKATDNQGATTTSSPVTITVVGNTNTAPTVNITSPANNASFNAGSSVTINANATDANGTVSKVEFFNGTTKLGEDTSSPYSFTWSNVAAGTYSITARATDNQNAITNSTAITIVVSAANALPTVSLTGPANNSTFTAPASLTLTATAADADGTVAKVEFFNGTTKLGEDTSSPYSFNWNNVAAGTYSLTARATDNRNAITNSAVVTLNVRANTLPSVSITSPANNSTFTTNSSITISANATDADGTVTKVEFYYGNTKLGEDATSPYSITWGNVPAGTYLLKAVAFDNNGGSSTSANITVTVGNLSNSLPSVSLTSPGNNATFPQGSVITLTASASDSDGSIAKVEFYNGTTKLGEDTASPYAFVWNNVPTGNYSLTAKATDDKNGVSTSAAVNINVTSPNNLPVANAGKDATVTLPDNTYLLQGSGEDSDGIIMNYEWTQVEGPNDATLTVSAGGEAMITNLVEGTYKFVLTVTDNGDLSSSDEIIIKVIPVSPASVQLPLVFTPNNDGIDDTWNWSNTEAFENCRLTIYNRLGQKIYETISYDNTWDGRVNGSPLQEDAYYYVITCDNSDRQGAVRIVR